MAADRHTSHLSSQGTACPRAGQAALLLEPALSFWLMQPKWQHLEQQDASCRLTDMPTLFRFLMITGIVAGVAYGGLWALAVYFEPEPREVSTPVPGIKVRQ